MAVIDAVGTTFTAPGRAPRSVHSARDLGVYQLSARVSPAPPKIKRRPRVGADGSVDLSDQPAGWPTFGDRKIVWTFGIPNDADPDDVQSRVSSALNGRHMWATLDRDPDYFYDTRLAVTDYTTDGQQYRIVVTGYAQPYKLRQAKTVVTAEVPLDDYATVVLTNGPRPVTPYVRAHVAGSFTVVSRPDAPSFSFEPAGLQQPDGYPIPGFILAPDEEAVLNVESSEPGRVDFVFREGAL